MLHGRRVAGQRGPALLSLALREGLEVQELAPHHHEIAPRKQPAHQRTSHPARIAHDELGEEPGTLRALRHDQVGDGEVAEKAEGARAVLDAEGEVTFPHEIHDGEDTHHRLSDGEMLQARSEGARTSPPSIVDPVVGVGGDAKLAQAAARRLPNNPAIQDTLGWIYYKKGLATLAIPPFQKSIELDPKNPVFHYHLGLAHLKNGDSLKARIALRDALTLAPNFAGAAEAKQVLASLKG